MIRNSFASDKRMVELIEQGADLTRAVKIINLKLDDIKSELGAMADMLFDTNYITVKGHSVLKQEQSRVEYGPRQLYGEVGLVTLLNCVSVQNTKAKSLVDSDVLSRCVEKKSSIVKFTFRGC